MNLSYMNLREAFDVVTQPRPIPPTAAVDGITHALLAVDGSAASLRAADRLRRMLRAFPEARLTVMFVAPLPMDLLVSGTGAKLSLEFPMTGFVRATSAPALDAAMAALGEEAARAESEAQVGDPADEICQFARTEAVDLIVIGTRGTGPDGRSLGTVSSKVVALAPCPVLLVQ